MLMLKACADVTAKLKNYTDNDPVCRFFASTDFKEYTRYKDNGQIDQYLGNHTRIVGLYASPGGAYPVYNISNGYIEWSTKGELKVTGMLYCLSNRKCIRDIWGKRIGSDDMQPNAICIGKTTDAVLPVLKERGNIHSHHLHIDNAIYSTIHFITLDQNGIRAVRIMSQPDWKRRIFDAVIDRDVRDNTVKCADFDCDAAYEDECGKHYCLCHLDYDVKKLKRFITIINVLEKPNELCQIICYEWQKDYVRKYLGSKNSQIDVHVVSTDTVEHILGITTEVNLQNRIP